MWVRYQDGSYYSAHIVSCHSKLFCSVFFNEAGCFMDSVEPALLSGVEVGPDGTLLPLAVGTRTTTTDGGHQVTLLGVHARPVYIVKYAMDGSEERLSEKDIYETSSLLLGRVEQCVNGAFDEDESSRAVVSNVIGSQSNSNASSTVVMSVNVPPVDYESVVVRDLNESQNGNMTFNHDSRNVNRSENRNMFSAFNGNNVSIRNVNGFQSRNMNSSFNGVNRNSNNCNGGNRQFNRSNNKKNHQRSTERRPSLNGTFCGGGGGSTYNANVVSGFPRDNTNGGSIVNSFPNMHEGSIVNSFPNMNEGSIFPCTIPR